MKSSDWIMVRLRPETHARLRAICERWERARERGRGSRTSSAATDPSINDTIALLLTESERKLEAGKRASAKRRKKRPGGPAA